MDYIIILTRSILVFLILLIFTKLLGKQHISQMTPLDFIVGMTIGSIAASASVELENQGLITAFGIIVWTVLAFIMAKAVLHGMWWQKALDGSPTILIENGHLKKENLAKENYTVEHLLMQCRKQGIFDIRQIQTAVLEIDGSLSILKKPWEHPLTLGDMNLPTSSRDATLVIQDGKIDQKGLLVTGLSKKWLLDQLKEHNIQDVKEVLYAAVCDNNVLHVDTGTKGA